MTPSRSWTNFTATGVSAPASRVLPRRAGWDSPSGPPGRAASAGSPTASSVPPAEVSPTCRVIKALGAGRDQGLAAATIASVRMNRPAIVFEPPPFLVACERCQEAYAEARRTIEEAGGLPAWMVKVTSPAGG
jgi:hypothetical protein